MADSNLTFIVDCGSDISVIKAEVVRKTQIYYPYEKCNISRIGHGIVSSLGTTYTNLVINGFKLPQMFHIVENNFPIPTDGILGRDFLVKHKCNIDYNSWLLNLTTNFETFSIPIVNRQVSKYKIPARCEIIKRINKTDLMEDSVIFSQEIAPGIFCANSIVTKDDCFVKFINTTNEDYDLATSFEPKHAPLRKYQIENKNKAPCDGIGKQKLKNQIKTQGLDPEIKQKVEALCMEYIDIFSLEDDGLSHNNFYEQNIQLNDQKPVYIKNYRTPESQKTEINAQVTKMLNEGIIRNSTSPFNSPVLLVPKKSTTDEKKWRLVIDFRQLNKQIIPDKFPLPRIDEILDHLMSGFQIDLMSGFHQIPLDETSKRYTAFSTETGHYEFNRLPFGLNISPNSFQRMMSIALSGLPPQCAFLYIDDIIVVGCSVNHHIANLNKVFQQLRKYNLKLNPQKCQFFKNEVTYLGHHISEKGVQPDKTKYSVISNYPIPKNADDVRRFVAFCNYYRRFIKNFAEITHPLNKLLRKNTPFNWTNECELSFYNLKTKLISPQILQFPDYTKEFVILTDASKIACGAVLAQRHDGFELPVAFASKAFTKGESNKSTIEQELTAIHWAINHFRPYIYGRKFVIKTDHRPLIYLFSLKNPSSKLTRMRWDLEEYNFEVEYIKGKSNVLSDALSRIQITSDTLKNMYIVTRSMTKTKNHPTTDHQTQKPDQLHVYDAINGLDVFDLPKLTFSYNSNNRKCINMTIYDKRFRKRLSSEIALEVNNSENIKIQLEEILKIIDGRPTDNENKMNISPKKLAIQNNDYIFKHIDVNSFKNLGNAVLRNATIIIYVKPVEITSTAEINSLLKQHHDFPIGGHPGVNRLYKKLKSLYSWKNMKESISNYVKSCVECKLNKHFPSVKTKAIITTTPIKPFDVVSIDTVGPFPLTENGNRYAVTMQCDFTKFVIIVPITDKSSSTIAKAVVQNCILNFGPMKSIKTDQGTEYKGVFDEICKLLSINHVCATAYHPQTIGALERNHRCLNEYLRIFCNESRSDWDEWMPHYCFSYNTTPSADHNYTPFELLFGRRCTDFKFLANEKITPLYNYDSYNNELRYRLQVTHSKVLQEIIKSKANRTTRMNRNIINSPINIGDLVFLKSENNHKLDQVHSGPFKIISFTDSNATIQKGNKIIEVHKTRLIKI